MPYGPFGSQVKFYDWINQTCLGDDPLFYTIFCAKKLEPIGLIAFMSIEPDHGSVEIGHVYFSPKLQKTPGATESIYLLMKCAFDDLGYRRVEWKCHNDNERSKQCATRMGFAFEGLFRQHRIYKSENRDTAWFSILDKEWPKIKARCEHWLLPDNFDATGNQIKKLGEF